MGLFGNFFVKTKEDIDREIASLYRQNADWEIHLGNARNQKSKDNINMCKTHIATNKAKIASLKAQRKTAPNKK